MDPDKKINPQIEKIRRELHRRSLDQIIVINPLEEEITVIWDKFRHVVPPLGKRTFPRYIAMKYIRETTDRMIYKEEEDMVRGQNKKRLDKGTPPMSSQEREQFALQYGLHLGNEEKRKEIFKQLYGGISEEYGVDLPSVEPHQRVKKDTRTFEEKMLDEMEKEADLPPKPPMITEQETKMAKDRLIKEVSKSGKENKKNN